MNMAALGKKKKKFINLLPQEEFAGSTTGRILSWTLSTFRIIVVITEMVVMGAFISRFWLDAKSSDLNEEIAQKEAIIISTNDFEKEFRSTQTKLSVFSSLTNQSVAGDKILETVSQYMPSDISLVSFSFGATQTRIKGVSPREISIAQLMENLRATGEFGEISLTQMDTLEESASLLVFTINIKMKGES